MTSGHRPAYLTLKRGTVDLMAVQLARADALAIAAREHLHYKNASSLRQLNLAVERYLEKRNAP